MNIIQLQDRLKGMPTEVIIQNLQSPTGAVPTYLLAGELSRRQKMEAEAAAEMPSDTVTEQLVEESMPQQNLGAMAPQSMAPQPVPPEQAMAAPGVAGLPAPNVGQNYAGGGIVSFAEGGRPKSELDIGEDLAGDLAVEAALISLLGPAGAFATPSEMGNSDKYTAEELNDLLSKNYAGGGIVSLEEGGFLDKLKGYYNKGLANLESGLDESIAPMLERDRIYQETGELPPMTEADLDTALNFLAIGKAGEAKKVVQKYGQKAWDKLKELTKSQPKPGKMGTDKKLQQVERAKKLENLKNKFKELIKSQPKPGKMGTDKKLQQVEKAKKLENLKKMVDYIPAGPLTKGVITTGARALGGAGRLGKGTAKALLREYPLTAIGGGLGYLAYDSYKENEARKKLEDQTKNELKMDTLRRKARESKERQEKIDAQMRQEQAAKDKQKQRELFLALALGGAKTMQGKSPYALQNIGAGLEGGVSAMSAFDIARAEREADLNKARMDREFNLLRIRQDQQATYNKAIADLMETQEYGDYVRALKEQADDGTIAPSDINIEAMKWLDARAEQLGISSPNKKQTTVNGREFSAL
jgi:hypothetical protein